MLDLKSRQLVTDIIKQILSLHFEKNKQTLLLVWSNILIIMNKFLLTVICILTGSCAYAHLGNISGTVYDQTTNSPLKGVNVQLSNQGKVTVTNELGQYKFEDLVASGYKVELSYVGLNHKL